MCDKTTEIMEASIYEAGQRERDKERCSGTESGGGGQIEIEKKQGSDPQRAGMDDRNKVGCRWSKETKDGVLP